MKINAHHWLRAIMCLSLLLWSVLPSMSHVPSALDTLQDHLEMVEDHGHSHGLEYDLAWAFHGHGHDMADHHDHSSAVLLNGKAPSLVPATRDIWQPSGSADGPDRRFPFDRPPRA